MSVAPDQQPSIDTVPKVLLKPRKARPFFGRHPWVYASAIQRVDNGANPPEPGAAVELYSSDDQFIAHGLYNPHSTIRVRLYSWDQQKPLNEDLIATRIRNALELRRQRFDFKATNVSCRLVFSEADELSGLVVDFYAGFLLIQFTSLALYQRRDAIVSILRDAIAPRGIWLRTEKGMREAEHLEAVDGLVWGEEPPRPLFIDEHGIQYGVDVQQGQKTGYYLDQRDNRIAAAKYAAGKRVLDAFCFSGGFGIAAAKQGARSVLGIDSSESALKLAAANAELNEVSDRCRFQTSDVRKYLAEAGEQGLRFDVVILDPPRMARTRGGLSRAIKGYFRLNLAGIDVLRPGGILVTCSCSGLVSRHDFQESIAQVARESGRPIQILEQHGQPADHPISVTCPETEYLKMLICRVG